MSHLEELNLQVYLLRGSRLITGTDLDHEI